MFNEYKASSDRRKMLGISIRGRSLRYFIFYLAHLLILQFIVSAADKSISDVLSWGILSLSLCVTANVLTIVGCIIYSKTFRHRAMALPTFLGATILICIYMYPFILSYHIFYANDYIYIYIALGALIATVYSLLNAKRVIIKEFSGLYFTANNKLFFDQERYMKVQKNVPFFHYQICFGILGITVVTGLYAKSFYWDNGWVLGMGLCSLCFAFTLYPHFIYAVYMLFVIHPRVEKRFNQSLLSDQWGIIEENPDLAEKFWGTNPVKRPIQYEEVFPEKNHPA